MQDTILRIHEYIDSVTSLNYGLFFILFIAAIIYSISCILSIFISKTFQNKSKFNKIIFVFSLVLSLVSILDFILAGDIYPNLSPKKVARLFAESLCNGRIEELTDNKNNLTEKSKVLTAHYRNQFFIEWEEKLKDLYDIGTNSEEFELIEYNYKNLKITDPETCFIRLRTSTILNMSEILEMKEGEPLDKIVYVDYDFNIGLIKVPIPSRFLGNYMRWRIFSFNYEKGKPYNFKEMIDAFK